MNNLPLIILQCFAFIALFLSANLIWAQSQTPLDIAIRHIEQNHNSWGLTKDDIKDIIVSDSHISSISGTAHIYFQQRYHGIKIHNGILNMSISRDGNILYTGKKFTPNLASKVNSITPTLGTEAALQSALNLLQLKAPASFTAKEYRSHEVVYDKGAFANRDVIVKLAYVYNKKGNLNLAWEMAIDPIGNFDYWFMHIDALTGELLRKTNLLTKCTHTRDFGHKHSSTCNDKIVAPPNSITSIEAVTSNNVLTNSYRVFALPTESPIHGNHVIVTNPEDAFASPLGWHDNGANQWTITRGNNAHAFLDTNANGSADQPEPDGGSSLDFDFPFNPSQEPDDMINAAQVNLFYMGNMMHDFAYHYGFDEAAGNFQDNNFGNGGSGNDHVIMRAQSGSSNGSLNNANFTTPPDGSSGVMNMFVWDQNDGAGLLQVDEPASISGTYATGEAMFGDPVSTIPVTGEVVLVNDDVYNPLSTDGCEDPFINGADLNGKIAMVDRGGCFFQQKTFLAEQFGAIAVIICNFEDAPVPMNGNSTVPNVTIPTVMIGNIDCQTIRQFAGNGLVVSLVQPTQSGPNKTDGDFDNGIIAHEYGHGITNRLTGGASNINCLISDPDTDSGAMGEGWGDWFALVTTVEPGDSGEDPRGVGNYAVKLPVSGKGVRRYPYSTDISVNPLTYSDAALNSRINPAGEIWCAMIWDLYWAMTDKYGWDANLNTGTGGNNMAIKLVMEGIKTQPCNPGFVSGRDAILAADIALYNGDNQCLIWEVFARRGCGFYADEGDPFVPGDQVEDFEPLPTCIPELKLTKSVSPLINAGDNITVTVKAINHKPETLTNVVVIDQLVNGLSYVTGSANITEVTVNGNDLSFNLGDMAFEEEQTITYQLATSPDVFSIRKEFDDVEYNLANSVDWWAANIITSAGNQFNLSTTDPFDGQQSWFVKDAGVPSQHQLLSTKTFSISGQRPAVRFYSQYNTQTGANGGLFEISTDGGITYQQLGNLMVRNGYPGGLSYFTFTTPNLDGFSGNSNGYQGTYVDLRSFIGQDVTFRFHFATDEDTNAQGGWYIDAFEMMDLKNYNTTTCAFSDQGNQACAEADEEGTIIESQISTTSIYDPKASVQVGVFPNPANEIINVTIASVKAQDINLSLVTLDGKEVLSQVVGTTQNTQTYALNVAQLPAGFYFIKAATNQEIVVEKVIIK